MKSFFTTLTLAATAFLTVQGQQLQKGDEFEYTNENGVTKTYTVVGDNLISNPSFDDGTTGWVGGAGGSLTGVTLNNSGGVDGGAYITPTESAGKGGNGSIGAAWEIEKDKMYVFSYYIKQMTKTEAAEKEVYIVTSQTNTARGAETKTLMYAHEDADCAWTQNMLVTTAEYSYLQFCARWLGGSKGFDSFVLAEVQEKPDPAELVALLESCDTWLEEFDEPQETEAFQAVINEAWDLIDGGEYTAAQLNAMVTTLTNGILDFRMANADESNLVDVTKRYIKNPSFDNGLVDWEENNSAVNNGTNCRGFNYFGELSRIVEINGLPSKDTYLKQTVKGLPKGFYRFTVDAAVVSTVAAGEKTGVAIFANGAELDMPATTDTYAETGMPTAKYTIEGVVTEDSIVVGMVGYKAGAFTYVAIDNIKFEFAGFNVGIYLQALIEEITQFITDNEAVLLPAIASSLSDAAVDADMVIGSSDEEMNQEFDKLSNLYKEAKASITKMQELSDLNAGFLTLVESTNYDGTEVATKVIDKAQNLIDGGVDTATYQTIVDMLAEVQQAINDYKLSQKASKDSPADYTFFIQNPNFEATDGWSWTHASSGADIWAGGCRATEDGGETRRGFNFWGTGISSLDLKQTLTGLPNGLYAIDAEMITQTGYATNQHLYASSLVNASNSAFLDIEGWDSYEWKTLSTGMVVVTDGTLTIGAASSVGGSASEGWFQITNFVLKYFGMYEDSDLSAAWENTLAHANEVAAAALKGDATVLNTAISAATALTTTATYAEACAFLQAPIAATETAVALANNFKKGAYQTAIDAVATFLSADASAALSAGIDFVDAILAADTTTSACLAVIAEKLTGYNTYSTYLQEVTDLVADAKANKYKEEYVTVVNNLIAAQLTELKDHLRSASSCTALKDQLAQAVAAMKKSALLSLTDGTDVTDLIIANSTITDAAATGWNIIKGTGNGPTITGQHWTGNTDERYIDSWNGTAGSLNFTAYQLLTGIPNGNYTLSVTTRTDGDNAYAFAAVEPLSDVASDSVVCLSIVKENTLWVPFKNYGAIHGDIYDIDSLKWVDDNSFVSDVFQANDGSGWGWSTISISDIQVTNHFMVIGMTTDSTLTKQPGFTGTWFSGDEWKLTLNSAGNNSDYVIDTEIEQVVADEIKETVYYLTNGLQVATPSKGGLYIEKTLYSNGKTSYRKVFIK